MGYPSKGGVSTNHSYHLGSTHCNVGIILTLEVLIRTLVNRAQECTYRDWGLDEEEYEGVVRSLLEEYSNAKDY